jgi:hypothetical protein
MHRNELKVHLSGHWTMRGGNLVAPATLMTTGVRCGSHGCLLWTEEPLRASTPQWNNIPVTLGHPVDENGGYVSINHSQEIHDQFRIGHLSDVRYAGGLKANLVVTKRDPATRSYIQTLREVSLGCFTDDEPVTGTFGDQQYQARVKSIVADHCAALPQGLEGACSWERDGCGIGVNELALSEKDKQFIWNIVKNQILGGDNMTEEIAPMLPGDILTEARKEEVTINEADFDKAGVLMPPEVRTLMFHQKKKQNPGDSEFDGDVEPLMLPPELL